MIRGKRGGLALHPTGFSGNQSCFRLIEASSPAPGQVRSRGYDQAVHPRPRGPHDDGEESRTEGQEARNIPAPAAGSAPKAAAAGPKPATKGEIYAALAEKAGVEKKQ